MRRYGHWEKRIARDKPVVKGVSCSIADLRHFLTSAIHCVECDSTATHVVAGMCWTVHDIYPSSQWDPHIVVTLLVGLAVFQYFTMLVPRSI